MSRFTLEYMTRFKCIAERCEDTCCAGMDITLSPGERETLAGALRGQPEELAKIIAFDDESGRRPFALARDPQGTCGFLQADRLCSVIKAHGSAVVPDACALFPRNFNIASDRVDMIASLGCPEAARLCLLHEGSTQMVPAPEGVCERWPPLAPEYEREPYSAMYDEVHDAVLGVLRDRTYPVATRLAQVAQLAATLDPVFHRGAAPAEDQVRAALLESSQPQLKERWAQDLGAAPVDGQLAIQTAMVMLSGLLGRYNFRGGGGVRFPTLVKVVNHEMQKACLAKVPNLGAPGTGSIFAVMWPVFQERRALLTRSFGPFFEQGLERYWINDWYRDPYTTSPNLGLRAFGMLIKAATLGYLLVGHPVLYQLAALRQTRELDEREQGLLVEGFVETVQIFVKHVERRDVLAPLAEQLGTEQLGVDSITRAHMFAVAA